MADTKDVSTRTRNLPEGDGAIDETTSGDVSGFDAERMRARSLLTADEEKKLMRRVDLRIMTICSLLFLMKNIDSDNISNARIMNKGTPRNIMTQLNMTSDEYNLLTVLYYVPYIVLEAPSNLLLKRLRPSAWQSRIMISWGIALLCHVPVTNKGGIYATRFILGADILKLGSSKQACTDRMKCRFGCFTSVIAKQGLTSVADVLGNLSGIFSGILAFAFDTVSGSRGLSGWQWLFLVEGLVTLVLGTAVYFLLPDFPPTAKWLTEKEKAFIQARLPPNAPRAEEMNFNFSEIVDSLKDRRLWLFTLIWATFTVGTSGVRFYQPTVIANLGFTTIARAQLLNLPISLLSIFVIGVTGFFADKGTIPRPLYPLGVFAVVIACYGVLVAYPSNGAVYAATLVGNAFTSAFFPLMWPWRVQTTSRATGSAFSIGFVNSYGQIGGAIGPQIFRSKYAPRYQTSFAAAMALVVCCAIVTLITWWVTRKTESDTRRLKRARVRAQRDGLAVLDDVVDQDLNKKRSSDEESA
ncbi:putative pantothenate transporter [Colletotrichum godetiae]|uniref:Pantothenate transporter n=1 Tax=Colletotrichum godetiae TaxID=1209918 RepID=A0AAJ0AT53_9PEZI|nr:putative pantothenate transporter [Colletotrichum godetiae]KAK1689894.1 putative pantothenate transporter [Colletotrichum godetiae]